MDFNKMGAIIEPPLRFSDARPDAGGALELIELGNARGGVVARRIEAASRNRPRPRRLGEAAQSGIFGYFFGVVGTGISKITGVLSDILKIPLDLVSKGVGEVLTGFAGIVGQIPVIGEIAAAILLAANAIVQAVLDLPEQILAAIGNLGLAFKTLTPQQQSQFTQTAMGLLVDAAPPEHKAAVQQKLEQTAPPGSINPEGEGFPIAEVAMVAANALAAGIFLL